MGEALNVLIVEDSAEDCDLLLDALVRVGRATSHACVQTRDEMLRELSSRHWDLVISDYVLPNFSGLEALKIVQESGLDIPFIIVSGKIGEEVAIEALQAGANDYLLKDRLSRLGPAIARALAETAQRKLRRQTELALKESEERYRCLVEWCPEAMCICVERKFLYVNPAAVALFGVQTPVDLLGKQMSDFVEPRCRENIEEYLCHGLDEPGEPLPEHRIICADGTSPLVEVIARHIKYHGEEAVQILFRDISLRKRVEAQALNNQKMEAIGRLAGGVANDFNNLLTVITGYTGLIRSALGPDHALQRDVQQISQSTERAVALTNQLLGLSRDEVAAPQALDLNSVVEEILPSIRRLMGEKVACVTNLHDDLHLVRADRPQMETILFNLALHARDSMSQGGKLTIETANVHFEKREESRPFDLKPGRYVVLTINDTGRGFSDEFRQHLFEPFFSSGEVGRNSGLGMATAYAIIKQHKGFIWCASEIGKGSTFQIYLPQFIEVQRPPTPKNMGLSPIKGQVILVVEDEEVLREFAQIILRKHGFSVLTARNGEEALKLLDNSPRSIDLIFSDVIMPRMGGAELFRRVSARPTKVPMLMTSGYPRSILIEAGIADEEFEFLPKPYTTLGLVEKIREMFAEEPEAREAAEFQNQPVEQ